MIKTINLKKTFQSQAIETTALSSINLEVKDREFVAIMGPSGCGKSTLLNIIGMLDNPSFGEYYFNGENISKYNEKQRAQLRKSNIGFVFQNFNLIDELTVAENVELPLIYLGVKRIERIKRVNKCLEEMHLMHRAKHFPQQLSGGQQQRVAVSRAVISRPRIILADEPTGNLDSLHGDEVMEMLKTLNDSGTTIIMVTHSQRDADYSGRIIRLFDGQIVSETFRPNIELDYSK